MSNLKIDLVPHTVFLLCGPTYSGKSTFSQGMVSLCEQIGLTYDVISSDAIRQDILRTSSLSNTNDSLEADRYSGVMSTVSQAAFEHLMLRLKTVTAFPINSEIVVVDTTGMDENFRKEVKAVADASSYNLCLVTFEYKYRSDYIPIDVDEFKSGVIERSVARFRQKVLPNLGNRDFPNRLRVKSRESFAWMFNGDSKLVSDPYSFVTDYAKDKIELLLSVTGLSYAATEDPIYTFAVIGDSHECTRELQVLVEVIEKNHPKARIVHIGDGIDKGFETKSMIDYLYSRIEKGDIFVVGNHEAYVARRLRKEISAQPDIEKTYFTALEILQNDAELAAKFLTLYDCSKPFVILCDSGESGNLPVYVTHAPCLKRHLGKVHDFSLTAQRNYRTKDRTLPILQEFEWLYKEAERNHPLHIFGHISHLVTDTKNMQFRNKVFLDTGAVYGGRLSAVIVKRGEIIDTLQIQATKTRAEAELPRNLGQGPVKTKVFRLEDYDLDRRDFRLLHDCVEKGVKYISGTMAPAPSTNTELETLSAAFEYLKSRGLTQVTLQPKYMGSRCQMYLFADDKAKTFATSRAGWVIRRVTGKTDEEYQKFLESVWYQYSHLFDNYGDIILDGELLPWSALGAGLIDDHFIPYRELVKDEVNTLVEDLELANLTEFTLKLDLGSKKGHIEKFEEALARYSQSTEPQFKAFDVLSQTKADTGQPMDSFSIFNRINPDGARIVELNDEASIEKAQQYFNSLTLVHGMEGVVAKPFILEEGQVPYMKIRSPEYLRLVYGYDYLSPDRYARLVRQKNISGKVRLSIAEHALATKLLSAVAEDDRKELIVQMIGKMKEEKVLDPRL